MKTSRQRITVGASVAAILGTSIALTTWSPVGLAADGGEDGLAEVTVTGSRIQRRDYDSNSPIVTVDSANLEERAGLNIESFLNQMPAFNPSDSPVTTQTDVQMSPVNSVGISTISLRGFGPNRNLVLVDGHRPVPVNALMVTDVNGIPSAMVERLEIISGGASAVYGADAIGGVTNFLLKKNFQGMQFDAQYGITEAGDGQETRLYSVVGTNFADNRGNVSIGLEYYNREEALQINRRFYTKAWSSPDTASAAGFLYGYNAISFAAIPLQAANSPFAGAVNAVFGDRPTYPAGSGPGAGMTTAPCTFNANPANVCNGVALRINSDGSLFTQTGNNVYKFLEGGGVIDGLEFALQNVYDGTLPVRGQVSETIKWNRPDSLASAPQDRFAIFASSSFDINDRVTFFARGNWNESNTITRFNAANNIGFRAATIPYNPTTDSPVDPTLNYRDAATVAQILANPAAYQNPGFIATGAPGAQHPVSLEAAVLLNSRPRPAADWIFETYPLDSFAPRATVNTTSVWQVETGLNIELPVKDWTAELYYSYGRSSIYEEVKGMGSLSRWRALLIQPDYGRNLTIEGNQPNTVPQGTFSTGLGGAGAQVHCTSGFYDMIFAGDARPSEDCINAYVANLQTRAANQQEIIELNLQGGLFDMWAGEVRGAAGYQYRKNSSQFVPDILQSTGSFLDQVMGLYPMSPLDASTDVHDVYAELLVPVVNDLPFMKRMELELGGRYSNYQYADSTFTYKATTNIQFTDWLRLRGGFNHATRAPNLGELFLNEQEVVAGGGSFGDPCSARSISPIGAAGGDAPDPVPNAGEVAPVLAAGQTLEGANSTYMICQAMMGQLGRDAFYGGNGLPGINASTGAAGGGGGGIMNIGNPNLRSEKANTWTAGIVFTSVSDNPWLAGFTAAVDWWKVDITDAIQLYSGDYANFLCYGTRIVHNMTEAQEQADTPACFNVSRNQASGVNDTLRLAYDNLATISTSGIDVQMNWRADLADLGASKIPGNVGLNVTATFLNYYKTKASPLDVDVETDWKGTLGPNLSGTNPGSYDYRINTSLSYRVNPFSFSLRWRFLPGVWGAAIATQKAIIANNERVVATGEGRMLTYTPSTAVKVASYSIFDLSFNWTMNDTLSLRAGIDNLLDRQPALTGRNLGRPYNPALSAAENDAALASVCSAEALTKGCQNPTNYSLSNPGWGSTSAGFYDTLGRRYYIGLKANF
jgi:outer membrane receptor protein involved in Fe transport